MREIDPRLAASSLGSATNSSEPPSNCPFPNAHDRVVSKLGPNAGYHELHTTRVSDCPAACGLHVPTNDNFVGKCHHSSAKNRDLIRRACAGGRSDINALYSCWRRCQALRTAPRRIVASNARQSCPQRSFFFTNFYRMSSCYSVTKLVPPSSSPCRSRREASPCHFSLSVSSCATATSTTTRPSLLPAGSGRVAGSRYSHLPACSSRDVGLRTARWMANFGVEVGKARSAAHTTPFSRDSGRGRARWL